MDISSFMEQILSKDNLNAAHFVQQAVTQVLTPIFEESFHDHSYGFRPNRCAQQAVLKALERMNDGHSWIVDIDLAKFFDIVDHDKLMTIFGRTSRTKMSYRWFGLKVNAEKSKVDKPKGMKYLGFGFYFDSFVPMVGMEDGVSTWLCQACQMWRCTYSDKQQEISRFWANLHAGLLHRKVCYLSN